MLTETKLALVGTGLVMAGIAGGFAVGYYAGQSDVLTACVRDSEFQHGSDYILCEIED